MTLTTLFSVVIIAHKNLLNALHLGILVTHCDLTRKITPRFRENCTQNHVHNTSNDKQPKNKCKKKKPITQIIKKYLPNHKMKWQVAEETKQMAIWHWQHYLA